VQPDGWEAAALDESAEALGYRGRVPGSAVGAYEEQACVGPGGAGGQLPLRSLGFVAGEQSDGVGVEDDVAVAGFALGFLVTDVSAAVRGDLVDDADLGFAEADFGV
jgi:hypothetical protein